MPTNPFSREHATTAWACAEALLRELDRGWVNVYDLGEIASVMRCEVEHKRIPESTFKRHLRHDFKPRNAAVILDAHSGFAAQRLSDDFGITVELGRAPDHRHMIRVVSSTGAGAK
jgi:hypothetical protein